MQDIPTTGIQQTTSRDPGEASERRSTGVVNLLQAFGTKDDPVVVSSDDDAGGKSDSG